ncbi:hypothetical protein O6H91_14G055400 [Diphasiastrum complanatum]|nr:hypothetical protein O6H91_14G055400 [Diphasiastrum complanatum]
MSYSQEQMSDGQTEMPYGGEGMPDNQKEIPDSARPQLALLLGTAGEKGWERFYELFGYGNAIALMQESSDFVWLLVYGGRMLSTPWPTVPRIALCVKTIVLKNTPAHTTFPDGEALITLDDKYVSTYPGSDDDVITEIEGVMYHEMTHVWQWFGVKEFRPPGPLIEGIADFSRLKKGFASENWVEPGQGYQWDQKKNGVTVYFLEYCDRQEKPGIVADLNAKLKESWDESLFYELSGKSVGQLWRAYKRFYKEL